MKKSKTNNFSYRTFLSRTVALSMTASLCLSGQAFAADEEIELKWEKRYTKDETRELVHKVVPTKDGGGLVWADRSLGDRLVSPLLMKADRNGQEEWSKQMPEEFYIADVEQAKEGGYLVMGALRSAPENLHLIKLSKTGHEEWTRKIAVKGGAMLADRYSLQFGDFAETPDGGVVVIGREYNIERYEYRFHIMKITASGEIAWDKPLEKSAERILVTKRGEIFLQSVVVSPGDDSQPWKADLYITKLSEEADMLWEHTYPQKGSIRIKSVLPASDDGLLVTGSTNYYIHDPESDDIVAWHIDSEGNVIWKQLYKSKPAPGEILKGKLGLSLSETADNGYMLIGMLDHTKSDPSQWNFKKLDQSGNPLWEKTISFPQVKVDYAVPQGNDQYLLVGEYWEKTASREDKRDIYLIKYGKPKAVLSLEAQLQKHKLKLDKGETEDLQVTAVYDDNTKEAVAKGIQWTSSNEEVTVVDENGRVTAKEKGKALITATFQGKTAVFPVQVK